MVAEGCDLYSVALHMQGWPVQAIIIEMISLCLTQNTKGLSGPFF